LLTLEKDILEAKVNLQKEFESCEEKEEIILEIDGVRARETTG
jgi:hypothetical protein